MKFFKEPLHPGDPIAKLEADGIMAMAFVLEHFRVFGNGTLNRNGKFWTLVIPPDTRGSLVDSAGFSTGLDPDGRNTLGRSTDPNHKGELQLYNVDNLPSVRAEAIPYFDYDHQFIDPNYYISGTLKWARLDSAADQDLEILAAHYASLQIRSRMGGNAGNDGILEVYGFLGSQKYQVPQHASNGVLHALAWAYPVTIDNDPCEIADSYSFLIAPTLTSPPAGTYATIEFTRGLATVWGALLNFTDTTNLNAYASVTIDPGDIFPPDDGDVFHNTLGDDHTGPSYFQNNFGSTCTCHDPRYWIKGEDYTENYGASIGRANDSLAIDLTNSKLFASDGTNATVFWSARELYGPPVEGVAPVTVDWGARELTGGEWTVADGESLNVTGVIEIDGTQVITNQQTVSAYTSDDESGAYSGIDNAQAGTPYAAVSDLNALRAAYETLRASHDEIRTALLAHGLIATA